MRSESSDNLVGRTTNAYTVYSGLIPERRGMNGAYTFILLCSTVKFATYQDLVTQTQKQRLAKTLRCTFEVHCRYLGYEMYLF
jgi:hypothetical protein